VLLQRKQATVLKWRQGRCRCWWLAVERFENAHMENVMDPGVGREEQAVGDLAHLLEDLEGTSVPRSKLAASTRR
jgi:hypothetical protein